MTPAFVAQMRRLLGLKFAPADMSTHWEALQDVPLVVLEAAVSRAQKTRSEFPSPVELREDADAVAHLARPSVPAEDRGCDLEQPITIGQTPAGTPITQRRVWNYYCDVCSDGGWVSHWCGEPNPARKSWQSFSSCERTREHLPHEWVAHCSCWESNPALQKKREREQKFAEAKANRRLAA